MFLVQSVRAMEHFALNTSSDVVQLLTNTSLDYELIRYYDITIRAQDNGVPSLARYVPHYFLSNLSVILYRIILANTRASLNVLVSMGINFGDC